jgi:two-component system phosphate regulon sensor histidine kinase PhoR
MDWSDVILLILVVTILVLYIRLLLKNKRLKQMADEANRLRLEASEAERRNRQLKQEMTSNIAHELKTPVSSIRGYLEILLSDKPVEDERRRYFLDRCFRQTLRLSDLIQDVSIINKLEESADLFPRTEEDATEVAKEAIGDLADKAVAAGITIQNNLPAMPLDGNHELLYCIFRNLVENSIAYAGEGVSIIIETYEPAKSATHYSLSTTHYFIHYYDTGKGVADEYLSRLFDRFVRIDEGRSRQNGGTGLGLSIVKHSVLFHGGEIYAKNRAEGGLEYFFSLKKQ